MERKKHWPQWVSEEFRQFCQTNGCQHIKSTPYHPKTNGLAEHAVRTFKKRMSVAKSSSTDINTGLRKFLMSYRNTPHKSMGRSPAELLFCRRLQTRLDLLKPDERAQLDASNFKQQRHHDAMSKSRFFAANDPRLGVGKFWIQLPAWRSGEPDHCLTWSG
jgi:transposase InsO family protein